MMCFLNSIFFSLPSRILERAHAELGGIAQIALCVEIDALEYVEYILVDGGDSSWATFLINAIMAVQIPILSAVFISVARSLTETENYQTESAFIDALALKCCYFEFFNHFGGM